LSEASSNLHVFYRFTVPGVIFTAWLFMMLPYNLTKRLMTSGAGGALLISIFLGSTVVIGWLAYFTIYPLWKSFLKLPLIKRANLYPPLKVHDEIRMIAEEVGLSLKPEHFWSYYLWNHCHEALRQRVKSLADFGHSLYMVSFTFTILPLIYSVARAAGGQETTLARLIDFVIGNSLQQSLLLETFLILMAFPLGFYILMKAKERVEYAAQIQWLTYKENREEIVNIMRRLRL
jgi:hypothetical protein